MYIKSIHEIIDNYDNFILDVWGVVHNGYELFPHVLDTLHELKQLNKNVVFLSNAPRRAKIIASDLEQFGVDPNLYHSVHTSGEDACEQINNKANTEYNHIGNKCYAIISPMNLHILTDCGFERVGSLADADFILNVQPPRGDGADSIDYKELLRESFNKGLSMLCLNPDMSVMLGDKVHECAGTLAQYYEEIGGKVYYHGKPFASVYNAVMEKFPKNDKTRTLAIGDGINTDIKGAVDFGIDSVLVLSGLGAHEAVGNDIEEKLNHIFKHQAYKPKYVCSELK